MLTRFKNLRLIVRISLLGISSALIAVIAMVSLAVWQSGQYNTLAQHEVDKLIEADLDHTATAVYNLIRTEHEAARKHGNLNFNEVRNSISRIKLGITGYVYVLGGKGAEKGKYIVSQYGKRDGENVWDTKDCDGRYVIRSIIAKATSAAPGTLTTEHYRWQNHGEPAPRWKTARLIYYEPLGWVIGTSVYDDELQMYQRVLHSGRVRMIIIMVIAGAVISIMIGLLSIRLAWSIGQPVMQLKKAVNTVIDGNLDHVVEVHSRDEIGNLSASFNIMTRRLKQNLTELEQTLAELRENEELLKMAQEMAHLGSWAFDPVHGTLYWSDEVYRIFGLDPRESTANYETFLDHVHPEDRAMVDRAYAESLREKSTSYEVEHRIIRKSTGEIRYVHEKCTHFRDDAGQIIGSIGMVHDITERRRAESALEKRIIALTQPFEQASDISFSELFNLDEIQRLQDEFAQATGVASIITHPDGTPITAPSNFCRLCSTIIRATEKGLANCYRSDAILGRLSTSGPVIQPCMSGGLWDAGAGISVGGKHVANWLIGQVRDETQTEEKMRDYAREIGADEETFVEAFREVPAMSRQQFERIAQALYTLANQLSNTAYQNVQQARFITERKRLETELQQLNSNLENRVCQRTAELEQANRELEGFCYSISHEFRAPLARLEGFSKKLAEIAPSAEPQDLIHCAERVTAASIRLKTVIDSMLTMTRISLADMNICTVDLSEMAERIAAELQQEYAPRILNVAIAPDIVAQGDRGMLEFCLRNLLGNAVKYTAKTDAPLIEFGKTSIDGTDIYYVRDNGIGFDMEYSKLLFQPFCRLHSDDEFEGTCIGLATVHRIIEKHGGRIWPEAEPGKGATFWFTLGS